MRYFDSVLNLIVLKMQGDKFVKEENEWPALSEAVSKNRTDGRHPKNVQTKSKDSNSYDGAAGYDSSKENNRESTNNNSGVRKKKKLSKVMWQPLQIETQPYRKRGTGRHNEMVKSDENNRYYRRHEYSNSENVRGNSRNGGFRGKRGRPYSSHRSYRNEETTSPEAPIAAGIIINGVTFFPQTFSDATLKNFIKRQMEYYFSNKNLTGDVYLRLKMDNLGFVPLNIFLNFPRIMCLTRDINVLAEAVEESNKLEIQSYSDQLFVRRVMDPLGWRISNRYQNSLEELIEDCYPSAAPVSLDGASLIVEGDTDAPTDEDNLYNAPLNEAISLNGDDSSEIYLNPNNSYDTSVNGDNSNAASLNGDDSSESCLNEENSKDISVDISNDTSHKKDKTETENNPTNTSANKDKFYAAPVNEDNSNITPLICHIENLHLNSESYPYTSLHMEPVDVQYVPSYNGHLSSTVSPSTSSPPELDIEMNGVFIEGESVNGCDYYSHSATSLEQDNECNFFPENAYNDVIFYDNDELSNQGPVYYVMNSSKALSDNSIDEALQLSPEPAR